MSSTEDSHNEETRELYGEEGPPEQEGVDDKTIEVEEALNGTENETEAKKARKAKKARTRRDLRELLKAIMNTDDSDGSDESDEETASTATGSGLRKSKKRERFPIQTKIKVRWKEE